MFGTLNARLMAALVGVILFLGAMGALLIHQMSNLSQTAGVILKDNYTSVEAANTMRHTALEYLVRETPAGRAAAITDFNRALQRELNDITEPGEGALAATIRQQWLEFLQTPNYPAYARLAATLKSLETLNRNVMYAKEARATEAVHQLTLMAIIGLLLSLAIAFIVAYWLGLAITRPLRRLRQGIHELGPGGQHTELALYGVQELDEVAQEFNSLLRRLDSYERLNVDKLVYESAKTDALINSIEDGILLLDLQGMILHVNFMAAMLLQTEPNELIGRNISDLNLASRFYFNLRQALTGLRQQEALQYGRVELSLTIRGRLHHYILRTIPFRGQDRALAGMIVVLQDVTELRQSELQRKQLVATLAHELKTPLTSLNLSVSTLLDMAHHEHYSGQAVQLLELTKEDFDRLTELVNNLLDLSRLDATRTSIEFKRLELCEFVRRQVFSFRLQAEHQDVAFVTDCEPIDLRADPVKLGWVFNNLISNALRYTPSHGVISIRAREAEPGYVLIEVSDTGPGIPPEQLPTLFEWYTQGEADKGVGNAGLGLAITREMVEAHGGRLSVASRLGEGTTFRIELPREPEGVVTPQAAISTATLANNGKIHE